MNRQPLLILASLVAGAVFMGAGARAQDASDPYPHMARRTAAASRVQPAAATSAQPPAPSAPAVSRHGNLRPGVIEGAYVRGGAQPSVQVASAVPSRPTPAASVAAPVMHAARAAAVAQSGASKAPAPPRGAVNRTETFFPSGSRDSSSIMLERSVPAEVRTGDMFTYEIKLTNQSNTEVRSVELLERMPAGFKYASATPAPTSEEGTELRWSLGNMGPRQSTSLRVTGSGDATGELSYCATVTFQTQLCNANRVVEPALELTMTATPEVILCDPVTLRYVVRNTGSGIARGVKVIAVLPAGWKTQDGRSGVTFDAGDLRAGQSKEATLVAKASETGSFTNTARATEEGGLSAEASADTRVTVPRLALTKTGPDMRYLGRPATFELTVSNDGDGPARDTVVVDDISAGTRIIEATQGGQVSGGRVTWNLGTLEPGARQTLSVSLVPSQIGTVRNTAFAKAYCGEASAESSMQVSGVSAVLLEVVDNDDPIEVGMNETYDIIVTNQGSADDTNIVIECTIPDEQEYVSSDGPTTAAVAGKVVRFAPLARLAPKAKAVWRVVVRGNSVGDVRFRTTLDSDQLETNVEETESTHIYE